MQHSTKLWVYATSLGGVESTLERRRRWKTEAATIPDGLIRLSVGIEDVEDLWDDLSQALDAAPADAAQPGAPDFDPRRVLPAGDAARRDRLGGSPRVAAVTRRVVVLAQLAARLGTHPGGIPDEASHTDHHGRVRGAGHGARRQQRGGHPPRTPPTP